MIFFHWEYILFPILLLSLVALILAVILAADMHSENRTRMETLKDFFREIRKHPHHR